MSKEETKWVDQEIQEMLRKGGGFFLTKKSQDQFLSTLFLVERKDEGNHPVCNLKKKKSN